MQSHSITGGGGLKLHVREWGNPSGVPLVFLHGWSQCHLAWRAQYEGDLASRFRIIAADLRGHGMSDAPLEREHYTDGDTWADDVAAILDQLKLARPILIGWSYGGYVICDYLNKYGDDRIVGINFVAAAVVQQRSGPPSLIGPGFRDHAPEACASDLAANISAIRNFLKACFGPSVSADEFETALAYNMVVHPKIRGFLLKRELDFAPVLERITVPVLVTHNKSDTVVLAQMSEYIASHCRHARVSWFDGVGHLPFMEKPERFNAELARFADDAQRKK